MDAVSWDRKALPPPRQLQTPAIAQLDLLDLALLGQGSGAPNFQA